MAATVRLASASRGIARFYRPYRPDEQTGRQRSAESRRAQASAAIILRVLLPRAVYHRDDAAEAKADKHCLPLGVRFRFAST
jgi:hypothetical protein